MVVAITLVRPFIAMSNGLADQDRELQNIYPGDDRNLRPALWTEHRAFTDSFDLQAYHGCTLWFTAV